MGWVHGDSVVWVLPLAVLLGYGVYRIYRRSQKGIPLWFSEGEVGGYRPRLRMSLRATGLGLVCLALLGPYFRWQQAPGNVVGRQVFFVLDISASMQTRDVSPSRLERAKTLIRQTATRLGSDPTGLIAFTEYGYVQCPLTEDREAFSLFLNLLESQQFSNNGTNFRAALSLAFNQLATEVNRTETGIAQAIVLISDGGDYGPAFASVVSRLKKARISVIPIGVGSDAGGTVPEFNPQGEFLGDLRDANGRRVVSQRQDSTLQRIAQTFRVPYLRLTPAEDPSETLLGLLLSLPPSILDRREEKRAQNLYAFLLLPGLVCWWLSLVLIPRNLQPHNG